MTKASNRLFERDVSDPSRILSIFEARTLAISEAEELTQCKSKTTDRVRRLDRFVLALLRARAQHRGARNRWTDYTRSMFPKHPRIALPSESTSRQFARYLI